MTQAKVQLNIELSASAHEHVEFLVKEIFKIFSDNVCKHPYIDFNIIMNTLCTVLGVSMRELLPSELHDMALQLIFIQLNYNRNLDEQN